MDKQYKFSKSELVIVGLLVFILGMIFSKREEIWSNIQEEGFVKAVLTEIPMLGKFFK